MEVRHNKNYPFFKVQVSTAYILLVRRLQHNFRLLVITISPGRLNRQRDWNLDFPNMDVLHIRRVLIVEKIKIYSRLE
jgi:hypothetical protein